MSLKQKTVIHWFRKGLRIHDNPALVEAINTVKSSNSYLRPIFILDPNITKWMTVGPNRWRFLVQSLQDLNKMLNGIGSRLYVVRGSPEDVFRRIFPEWNVSTLTFEMDVEPFAKKRDCLIESISESLGVKIIQRTSHTLYNPEEILVKNLGKPPLTYQKFLSVVDSLGCVKDPLAAPSKVPEGSSPPSDTQEADSTSCYDPPTLSELGVNALELNDCFYPGGESEGLKRLEKYISKRDWIRKFEKPNTSPNSIEPSTTVVSPYLKFGCLSARLFYHQLKEVTANAKHTKPPVSLIGQLMWREFYYVVANATPNFDRMVGNSICCQIPWKTNDRFLDAWKFGKTGYPFIDAIMRQLRQEGWIHHLARHAVACFLTRGDLWISWEEGQKVFEELLLDADWALNAGNWMWLSASAFFHQYFRVYSPVAFGKKTDKDGIYIKKYVPELSKYPSEYIYEPWKAPLAVQKAAKCLVGDGYPKRIVVHEEVLKENISRMAAAYKQNKLNKETEDKHGDKSMGSKKRSREFGHGSLDKFVKKTRK